LADDQEVDNLQRNVTPRATQPRKENNQIGSEDFRHTLSKDIEEAE